MKKSENNACNFLPFWYTVLSKRGKARTTQKKVMNYKNTHTFRDMNNWKEFFNEVAAACNYWELGFGDIDAEYESEVVRWAFVNKLDVDAACDAWREAVAEIAIGG